MSYQQGGPAGAGPYQAAQYQQAQYVPRRPGTVLLAAGVILVLLGIVAGGGIYVAGKERFTSRVTSLVEDSGALSGCVTDLSVSQPGTYTLYYISKGSLRLNAANDGCSNNDVVPIAADPNPPEISMVLRNPDGKKLKMSTPTSSAVLSAGGVVAEPYRQVNIGGTGDYELEIAMPDTGLPFAIGIGPKIEKSSSFLALVVGLFGVVFGVGCGLLGAAQNGPGRRRQYAGGYPPQYPQGYAPQQPVAPGYGQQAPPVRPGGPVPPRQPQQAGGRPVQVPPVVRPVPGQPGVPGAGPRPVQQPPVQRPAPRPAPGQQPPQSPQGPQQGAGPRPGGQRPSQAAPGAGPRPSQPQPPQYPASAAPTTVQPQQAPPTVRQPAAPTGPRPPQGQGLPPIVSSQDESGSLSTAPPTQRMPGLPTNGPTGRTGWERESTPPPTRPVSSQRPETPTEPTEDLDSDD